MNLVLSPDYDFAALGEHLWHVGWRLADSAATPIVPGEPEHAVFERATERLFYTFNPVCQLRVLEIPENLDATTRAVLPAVDSTEVESWLTSADERTLLRGVLAVRLLKDVRLIDYVEALRNHPRAAIAKAADRASEELRAAGPSDPTRGDARAQALAAIEVLKAQVTPLLEALARDRSGAALEAVKPRAEDYAKAFIGEAAEKAREAYAAIWEPTPDMRYPDAAQTVLDCDIAPAGMLAYDNELSYRFPGGYRSIAHLLDPHRVWVRWKFTRPGESAGMAYDGLVWLDDHWAWFPKPYRALAHLAQ